MIDLSEELSCQQWGVKFPDENYVHYFEFDLDTGLYIICTYTRLESVIKDIEFYHLSTKTLFNRQGRHICFSDESTVKPMNLCESCEVILIMRQLAI